MRWRVVLTDSEAMTGVAPECDTATVIGGLHDLGTDHLGQWHGFDEVGVYDCCPKPHLECGTERHANAVMNALNDADAEEVI